MKGQDPASAETKKNWLSNYLGASEADSWNDPLSNDGEWWSGLDKVVERMLITVASNEMMATRYACFGGGNQGQCSPFRASKTDQ